jgi:hypothetical protein
LLQLFGKKPESMDARIPCILPGTVRARFQDKNLEFAGVEQMKVFFEEKRGSPSLTSTSFGILYDAPLPKVFLEGLPEEWKVILKDVHVQKYNLPVYKVRGCG